jgi:hypothetical protein
MNWVQANREVLSQSNYVLKANTNSGYWFGIWKKKLDEYRSKFKSDFNVILFGNEVIESDFYVIPFRAIQDLLTEDNLYSFNVGKRWIGDIRNHALKFRHSQIERNISAFFSVPKINSQETFLQKDNLNDYAIENARKEINARVKQSIFRKKVLENFNYQCCLTYVKENELLVASHIIPWATKIETRLSPHNGLCLSVLYDSLFDKGYFTINKTNEVVITSRLGSLSKQTQEWLNEVSGKKIALPQKYEISRDAFEYHRNYIFDKF